MASSSKKAEEENLNKTSGIRGEVKRPKGERTKHI